MANLELFMKPVLAIPPMRMHQICPYPGSGIPAPSTALEQALGLVERPVGVKFCTAPRIWTKQPDSQSSTNKKQGYDGYTRRNVAECMHYI